MSKQLQKRHKGWFEFGILFAAAALTALTYNLATVVGKGGGDFEEVVQAGHKYMDTQVYDKAIVQYRKALEIDSLKPDVMVDLGACYHALGENDKAMFQFLRALRLEPKHPVALFNMGIVELAVGDISAVKKWWNMYLEVAPNGPEAAMVREHLQKL